VPIVVGFHGDLQGIWQYVHFGDEWQKNSLFYIYGHFRELFPTFLGVLGWFTCPWHSVHVWEAWQKTRRFWVLGPFSWVIADSFGVLQWFTRSMTLSTFLRRVNKNSSFLRFRAVFMNYCQQFWGSRVFYKAHETQYIFETRDPKLIVFAF
jgi:hypothetical protein